MSRPAGALVSTPIHARVRESGSCGNASTSKPGLARSTRTTSAPRSARTVVANGAGASPASSTTLSPASGPAIDSPCVRCAFPLRSYSVREMISFMISLVPPKIRCTRADVQAREIGYSFM